ncbi:hypothetical protein WL71_25930 [Burkholderia ubonensis]|uniref:Uncharacterized protein n=1 Tax=Burkholderia ubonensis TaxID=101571 RepID=A0A107GA16_9BURK|nr:hypothetical protein WL70_32715 [Burkholderia ubonensis]KWD77939.1 hypothetical protein WL71_25930 [Burkholderia ubonensis]KWD98963.1 hypothetical protein WL72_16200 [Burkholderia ubonensis]KWE08079.1 hypothetical protein WL73_08780 [Burkholderia ubonensis]
MFIIFFRIRFRPIKILGQKSRFVLDKLFCTNNLILLNPFTTNNVALLQIQVSNVLHCLFLIGTISERSGQSEYTSGSDD